MINKKCLVVALVVCSFVFSRTSTKYKVVVSPDSFSVLMGKDGFIVAKDCLDGKKDAKWKRRHKRRKKTRRPQRGR